MVRGGGVLARGMCDSYALPLPSLAITILLHKRTCPPVKLP